MINCNILLFDDFETLDALGPAEIFGKLNDDYNLEYFSLNGGIVTSAQNLRIDTVNASEMNGEYILLVPGGQGTRTLVNDAAFLAMLKDKAQNAKYMLTVCTGSGLVAKTGIMKGKKATSNKKAFDWAANNDSEVDWIKKARWVVDGNLYSSSGVSAGMDMAFGFIADMQGLEKAEDLAARIEYIWNKDKDDDPFAI